MKENEGSKERLIFISVPDNFLSTVTSFCEQGFRLIALASKPVESGVQYASRVRSEIESDLNFLGVLVLENKLKQDSAGVIQHLDSVGIRQVMITGWPEIKDQSDADILRIKFEN